MHFPIITWILFFQTLILISTQRLEGVHKVTNLENLETPSPEWIKYQQERFQHNIKTQILPNNALDHKPVESLKPIDKVETTSRQSNNVLEQHQADLDAMILNAEKIENAQETNEDVINTANGVQFPSIQGFIGFLKSLKQTWMNNSIFRIDDKIKLLHKLKDNLMRTIEKQFMILWQDDDDDDDEERDDIQNKENANNQDHLIRRKRGILDESNINFPPDAALMSINFLTFAVFLIKLVLQVVNIIKSKHYQLSTFNTDTAIRNTG